MDKEKHSATDGTNVNDNGSASANGCASAKRDSFWRRAWLMYYDGFRNMTVGKTLWVVILIKLFLIFVILKWIFFPDFLNSHYDSDADKAVAVRENLTNPDR